MVQLSFVDIDALALGATSPASPSPVKTKLSEKVVPCVVKDASTFVQKRSTAPPPDAVVLSPPGYEKEFTVMVPFVEGSAARSDRRSAGLDNVPADVWLHKFRESQKPAVVGTEDVGRPVLVQQSLPRFQRSVHEGEHSAQRRRGRRSGPMVTAYGCTDDRLSNTDGAIAGYAA